MKSTPLISVIITVFNRPQFISQAIDSVLAQTYKNYEIILVDDGSTNKNLKKVLEPYIKNKKIRCIYQKNTGLWGSRNTGIKNAEGEFIAFLDDDDLWLPKKLEKQVPLFKDKQVGLVYSGRYTFGEGKNKTDFNKCYKGWIFDKLLEDPFITGSSTIVRKECLKKVGLFKPYKFAQDYELWLRISKKYKADFVSEHLVKYRVHSTNISKKKKPKYVIWYLKNIFKRFDVPKEKQKIILSKTRSNFAFYKGYNYRKTNKYKALFYYLISMYYTLQRNTTHDQILAIKKLFNGYYKNK
ncbi:glycosyltransferase family 2 protein [Candidatus Woesearchaeota archaeon]|nr:glycosyltransferase family 2 protein [Candidatus Woesearchaeota archaeon]